MAINPLQQQLLNPAGPGQAPIGPDVGSVLRVAPTLGPSTPLAAAPLSPLSSLLNAGAAVNAGYVVPTQQQAAYQPPSPLLSGSQLEQLAQQFAQLQAPQQISPSSQLINQLSHGQIHQQLTSRGLAGDAAAALGIVGKGIWDSTIGGVIHTGQTKGLGAAILQGLEEAGLTGAAIAGTIIAPEITLPFLALLGTATTLPGFLGAAKDEIENPTDQNLVRTLVSGANLGLAVGSPFRAVRQLGMARELLTVKQIPTLLQRWGNNAAALRVLMDPSPLWRQALDEATPVGHQMQEIPATVGELNDWLARNNLSNAKEATDLLQKTSAYEGMVQAFRNAPLDPEARMGLVADIRRYMKQELGPSRYKFAVNFGGRPEITAEGQGRLIDASDRKAVEDELAKGNSLPKRVGLQHPDLMAAHPEQFVIKPFDLTRPYTDEELELGSDFLQQMDRSSSVLMGTLRGIASGHGFGTRPDLSMLLERAGAGPAGGGLRALHNRMIVELGKMEQQAGIKGEGVEDWQRINDALEDETVWDSLSPEQKYFARQIGMVNNVMTAWLTKRGVLDAPYGWWFPRHVVHEAGAGADLPASRLRDQRQGVRRKDMQAHRSWNAAWDSVRQEGQIIQRYPTAKQMRDEFAQKRSAFEAARPLREVWQQNRDRIIHHARSIGAQKAATKRAVKAAMARGESDAEVTRIQQEGEAKVQQKLANVASQDGELVAQLAGMPDNERTKIGTMDPGAMELMHPRDSLLTSLWRFQVAMHENDTRSALNTLIPGQIRELVGQTDPASRSALRTMGIELRRHAPDPQGMPQVLTEDVLRNRRDADREAAAIGYSRVLPSRGDPGTMNYQPAIYVRQDLAKPYLDGLNRAADPDEWGGVFQKTFTGARSLIMISPAWHFMNMTGRLLGFALSNPELAGAAIYRVAQMKLHDPEQYYETLMQAYQDGMVPANRFQISMAVQHLEQERTGQHTWLDVVRTPSGKPITHAYNDLLENGFWKMVDDLQLTAYLAAMEKFKQKAAGPMGLGHVASNWSDAERGMLAAEYANKIGGMVNKQYISQLWQHMSQLLFFAPRYWSTFYAMAASAFPGATRLSHAMAALQHPSANDSKLTELLRKLPGGGQGLQGLNPIKLRSIDLDMRRELMRAQRSWFLTYMAGAVASADLANVMFSGKHLWENPQGRNFDVCFDKYEQPTGEYMPGSEPHACMSGMPFFRQASDLMNLLGVGHDWGMAHQISDPVWQQADLLHKTGLLAMGILHGAQRQAAKMASIPIETVFTGLTGVDWYNLVATGTVKNVPNWQALLDMLPAGFQAQQAVNDMKQLGQDPGTAMHQIAGGLEQQLTGIPSIYWMKAEQKPISDKDYNNYVTQRTNMQIEALNNSDQLMAGAITPYQWWNDRENLMTRQMQLDVDTFGNDTPVAALQKKRSQLATQYGVDNPDLTDSQRFQAIQLYEQAWNQALEAASPQARSAWWDKERSQWTDADYLYWMAQQTKDGIMGALDGQNGAHIRAAQQALGTIENLVSDPTILNNIRGLDPYLYAYHQVLQNLGRVSPLGALVGAFTSPYSNVKILPPGMDPRLAAQLSYSGDTLIESQVVAQLVQQARQLAQSPLAEETGGQPQESRQFQQGLAPEIQAAGG